MINRLRRCLLLTTYFVISPGLLGVQFVHVSPNGSDTAGDGSEGAPFASPEHALQTIADTILQSGLPDGGFEVRLREGEYFIASPLVFDSSILGQASRPIVLTSEPGETARLTGGVRIDPGRWVPIKPSDRLYTSLPIGSREQVLVADLPSLNITEFGNLAVRGFKDGTINALELFVDGHPMQLARWPNPEEDTTPATDSPQVILTGNTTVAGTYNQTGTADGKPYYTRDGLVNGLQYHLYRLTWFWEGSWYTAWFLTTNESGYPSSVEPFWSCYADELGTLNPATGSGATGTVFLGDPSEEKLRAGLAHTSTVLLIRRSNIVDRVRRHGSEQARRISGCTVSGSIPTLIFICRWHPSIRSRKRLRSRKLRIMEWAMLGLFYALNLIHELDQPGEYYLDRTTGKLYLWPPLRRACKTPWFRCQ